MLYLNISYIFNSLDPGQLASQKPADQDPQCFPIHNVYKNLPLAVGIGGTAAIGGAAGANGACPVELAVGISGGLGAFTVFGAPTNGPLPT